MSRTGVECTLHLSITFLFVVVLRVAVVVVAASSRGTG